MISVARMNPETIVHVEWTMNWHDYNAADPDILAGKPIIKGTRLSVELILERMADDWTLQELMDS